MRNRTYKTLIPALAACLLGVGLPSGRAADDGRGTNYVNLLRADTINLGGEARTTWPTAYDSIGGTELDLAALSGAIVWGPVMAWNGQLQKAQMQVNEGTADVLVVRAPWNETWGGSVTVNTLRVTADGVSDATWNSSWISNDYRIGILVTNTESANQLWWSVTYTRE